MILAMIPVQLVLVLLVLVYLVLETAIILVVYYFHWKILVENVIKTVLSLSHAYLSNLLRMFLLYLLQSPLLLLTK